MTAMTTITAISTLAKTDSAQKTKIKSLFHRATAVASLCLIACGMLASLPSTVQAHDRYVPVYQERGYTRYAPIVSEYQYIYYPHQQVYFSPLRRQWFWSNGGAWQSAAYLPSYISIDTRLGGVPITLRSERPYFDHVYVERIYGRPWRASHAYHDYYGSRREEWREERREDRRDDWREHRYGEYRR